MSVINMFAVALSLVCLAFFSDEVNAQSISKQRSNTPLSSSFDCSEVNIKYKGDDKLTRAEKIALMDEALLRSLSKFDDCNISQITSSHNDRSNSNSLEQNTGGGSVASSDMSGTDMPKNQEYFGSDDEASANAESQEVTKKSQTGNETIPNLKRSEDNGKIPEDLLNVDNDSVLQAQIRKAAVNEKDPQVRAKLWNEYRKYKGKPEIE